MPENAELIGGGKHLRLLRLASGWEYTERVKAKWAVVVVAVTDEGKLLLIEQFRPPVGCRVLELPAGLVGDEADDEQAEDAARRELLEETGFAADRFETLAKGPISPGLSNELIMLMGARSARRIAQGGGIGDEQIEVHEVALDQVAHFARMREMKGVMVDPKIFSGLHFANSFGGSG